MQAASEHEAAAVRHSAIATPHVTGHHDHTSGGMTASHHEIAMHAHLEEHRGHASLAHAARQEGLEPAHAQHMARARTSAEAAAHHAQEHHRLSTAAAHEPAAHQTGKKGGTFVVSASGKKRYVRK